ncbi:MAG TPA: glycosyltransferase family 2 protein [Rhizomicrobium sp.]|jgi:glycosyltransferase involved in cell wall biosynthesis|nr:glycosyltransferase family 2 protein [Rhizomicrobium sp.]
MAAPFFSVVIPVYNRAKALAAAIASVRAQSFQDFEIVVVDDGSQDNPRAVVDRLNDPRIHFIRQLNAGGGAARNTGIDHAQGAFVAFLDSDDVFLPGHLEAMHALLEGTTGLVGYARVRVDRGQRRVFLKPPRALARCENMAEYLLCDRGFTPTSTMVAPRETAAQIRFDEHLRVAEDTDFAIRLSLAGCRFQMLEAPSAVWKDTSDPGRLSASKGGGELDVWLSRLKPEIPTRAWHGARGWAYAKLIARQHPLAALGLYLNAVLRGCYRPRLAAAVFLQIFLGPATYRRLADTGIAWLRLGLRERTDKAPNAKLEQA